MWDLGFKSAETQSGFCTLCRRSIPQSVCRSIVAFAHRSIVVVDGQLRVFIILSPKCTKITNFLQINPKPENMLERLQNNYNVFENTYILWLKVGKIHGISNHYMTFGISTTRDKAASQNSLVYTFGPEIYH